MPNRRSYRLFVALACGGMVAGSSSFAISACSSSSDAGGGGGDSGGIDATNEQRPPVEASDVDSSTITPAQCKASCKADHPNAVPKEDAIDKCWADNCMAPCIDQSGDFDAGDAGDDGGDGGAADAGGLVCGTTVQSGVTALCDRCTEAFCCTAWRGCFTDPDCAAYDKCFAKCNAKP